MIEGLNHCTVIAGDLERTVAFYEELVGLERGPRPDLGFAGAWLYAGGRAVLHVYGDRGSGNCLKVKLNADATGTPYVWHEVLARSGGTPLAISPAAISLARWPAM